MSRERFLPLLGDSEFRAAVKLARAANAVLFCQIILIEERESDSPEAQRARMNAFLYLCPVLYEAIDFVRVHVGRDLRSYSGFQRFRAIFRDREIMDFIDGPLKRIRNQGVFHFSSESIPDGLAGLDREAFDFIVAEGDSVGGTYHALADEAVVHAGFEVNGTTEEVQAQLRPLMKRAADLSARFSEAADQLVAEVLLAKGWRLEGDVPIAEV